MFRRCFSSYTRLGSFEKIDKTLDTNFAQIERKIDTTFDQLMREIEESRRRSDQFQRQITEAELNRDEIYFWASAAAMSIWFSFLINKAHSSASKQSRVSASSSGSGDHSG